MTMLGTLLTIPFSQVANSSVSAFIAQRTVTHLMCSVTGLPAAAAGEVATLLRKMTVTLELRPAEGEVQVVINRVPCQGLASIAQLRGQESYAELDELIADAGATAVRQTFGFKIELGQIVVSGGDELYLQVDIGSTGFLATESVFFGWLDDPDSLLIGETVLKYAIWDQAQNKVMGLIEAYAFRRDITGGLASENSSQTPSTLAFLIQAEDGKENTFDAYGAMACTLASCQGFNPPKDTFLIYRDKSRKRVGEAQTITLNGSASANWTTITVAVAPSVQRSIDKALEVATSVAKATSAIGIKNPAFANALHLSNQIPHPTAMMNLAKGLQVTKSNIAKTFGATMRRF